jgi:acid phosphatase family membrane protein YuiD
MGKMRVVPVRNEDIISFLANPIFLSAFFSLFLTQLLKVIISLYKARANSLKDILSTLMWKTGGMPSSHSALMVSMTTAIALKDGINSSVFILSLFFSLVVIRDAMGVRRSAGLTAHTLNQLGKELNEKSGVHYRPVKEVNGHTPLEVFVGSILGFFIAIAFFLL